MMEAASNVPTRATQSAGTAAAAAGSGGSSTAPVTTSSSSAGNAMRQHDIDNMLAPLNVDGFRNLDPMHTDSSELSNGRGEWPSTVNMYSDVLPNPRTRVKLATFNGDPSTDYINANYVRDRSGKFTWIAAQGPMDTTINNFWRMIWEKKIPVIVMLTRTVEGNVRKCAKYLPEVVGEPEVRGFFEITLDKFGAYPPQQEKKSCFKSHITMRLRKKDGSVEERRVVHFWLNSWPDHGRPHDAQQMLTLAATIRKLRATAKRQVMRPTLVHCSAGVGRSGSFIAMIDIIEAAQAGEKVDLLEIIKRLREDRCRMVNTVIQYEFLFDAAYEYLVNGSHAVRHQVKTLPRIEPGTNPGFTITGPKIVHKGNVNDELLNAFFIKSVKPGSVADKAGLEAGDRLECLSHEGIPKGKDGKQLVFKTEGKTLDMVKAELLRGIGTRKPVLLTVSRQKIAMAAQQQLRLEEEAEEKVGLPRGADDFEEERPPQMEQRIKLVKSLYRREKKKAAEEDAEENAMVEAVEEYDAQQEREYEERVLREMEAIATSEVEELLSGNPAIARLNSADLKNRVISEHFGRTFGVQDSCFVPSASDVPEDTLRQSADKIASFTSVDQINWNDEEFMDQMLGHGRTNSYAEATRTSDSAAAQTPAGAAVPDSADSSAPPSISSDILSAADSSPDRAIGPTEAAAAGLPRRLFRQLDTDRDGKVTVEELRKASADGLLQARPPSTGNPAAATAAAGVPFKVAFDSHTAAGGTRAPAAAARNDVHIDMDAAEPDESFVAGLRTSAAGASTAGDDTFVAIVDV